VQGEAAKGASALKGLAHLRRWVYGSITEQRRPFIRPHGSQLRGKVEYAGHLCAFKEEQAPHIPCQRIRLCWCQLRNLWNETGFSIGLAARHQKTDLMAVVLE
jgi:hypothetical protein